MKYQPGESIYVLSSSIVFNSSILKSAVRRIDNNRPLYDKIRDTYDVDKRDGLPIPFFKSKYVLVAAPIQRSLSEKDQQVVCIPARKILERTGIGTKFKKLDYTFNLDNEVKVYIYKKVEDFNYDDLNNLLRDLFISYPEWQSQYSVVPLSLFDKDRILGFWYNSDLFKNRYVLFSPGRSTCINCDSGLSNF